MIDWLKINNNKARRCYLNNNYCQNFMNIDSSKKFGEKFFTKGDNFRKIDFLVLHHIAANSLDEAISMLLENGVSSHFIIDEMGKIFQLVDENDIAYHAGISHWSGVDSLNKNSIGIEFLNANPFEKKFSQSQMIAGVELSKYLINKYQIKKKNIVGHSDIAYDKDLQTLDRKQDPSHLFDWNFLAENLVGIKVDYQKNNQVLFRLNDIDKKIKLIKIALAEFGYRVLKFDDVFDHEMQALVRVFNRRFIGEDCDFWRVDSQEVLNLINNES